jgi:hypothetical protein
MTQSTSKRHQLVVYRQNISDSHGSVETNDSKSIPNTYGLWGHPKDAKAEFKESSNSTTFDKHLKRERSTSGRTTTRGTKTRNDCQLRRSIDVVIQVLE